MNFNDFVGNLELKEQIQRLFIQNKVFHAILLEGEKGLGKKTFANIIAQTVLCEQQKNGLACEVCKSCHKVKKNIHPDVIYPDKTGVLQSYSIATIRKIRADAYVAANEAELKIYILSDVDNMGIPAQNALLKVLEEPPQNVIFILTCTSTANILPTIRSRMQQMALKSVSRQELCSFLEKSGFTENIEKIWEISNGNIGLAFDLVTSSDKKKTAEIAEKIALSLGSAKEFDLISLVEQISDNRQNFSWMLSFFAEILRNSIVLSTKFPIEKNNNCAKMLSEKLSIKQTFELINITNLSKKFIEKNMNMSILTTFFCSNVFKMSNCCS